MMIRLVFLLFLLVTSISTVYATNVATPSDFPATMDVAKDFTEAVPGMIQQTLSIQSYQKLYRNLFLVFAVIFLVQHTAKYMLGDLSLNEAISAFIVLGFIGSAPLWFESFIYAALSFSQGLGNTIQYGVLGNSNPNYPIEFMFNVVGRFSVDLSWNPLSWASHLIEIIILILVGILMVFLAVASVVAALLQSYIFVPLALIGLIVIPFGLLPIMGFLLDGWLRSFIVVVFFGVFARISVSLAVFGLSIMFNVHDVSDFTDRVFEFNVDNIFRLLGAASIALLSLWSVFNAYQMAASIVSGMAGGLFGGMGAVSGLNNVMKRLGSK